MSFFRKYQTSIYAVITTLILCSFFFFGSNSTIQKTTQSDKVSFYDLSNKSVTRRQVDQLMHFITTDQNDFFQADGSLGANFLNQGQVLGRLLQAPVASEMFQPFEKDVKELIQRKKSQELNFRPYEHPTIPFISLENLWQQYTPHLYEAYQNYKRALKDSSSTAEIVFKARLELMQAQSTTSPTLFKRVLMQQQRQYEWIPIDENLFNANLSLYGYQNLMEWLGRPLTRRLAEVLINIAALAENKGYKVDDAEVELHLQKQLELGYHYFQQNPNNPSWTTEQFYTKQLALLSLTESQVKELTYQLLLADKFLKERAEGVLINPAFYRDFLSEAYQTLDVECFRPSNSLLFQNNHQMHLFEIYLSKTHQYRIDSGSLMPPKPLSLDSIASSSPEFVIQPLMVSFKAVHKDQYAQSIDLKTLLEKQTEKSFWNHLIELWPDAISSEDNVSSRLQKLQSLDPQTRSAINQYTRLYFLNQDTSWIDTALSSANFQTREILISENSTRQLLPGVSDTNKLLSHLNLSTNAPYTEDNVHYYQFEAIPEIPEPRVISFEKAVQSGLLENHLAAYIDANSSSSSNEQNPAAKAIEKENEAFSALHQAIQSSFSNSDISDVYQYRFYSWLSSLRNQASSGSLANSSTELFQVTPFEAKLIRKDIPRGSSLHSLFNQESGAFSEITLHPTYGLSFFQLKEVSQSDYEDALHNKVRSLKAQLQKEVLSESLKSIVDQMQSKKAMSSIE